MIPYRVVIVPSRKGMTSSANVWMVISGTLSETKRLPVPKAALNFEYRVSFSKMNIVILVQLQY